jgi:hypothetical protein
MRECRTSGSVRVVPSNSHPYRNRRTRRASGWLQGKQRKPYRQERGVGTRAVNPERADPRGARQRQAMRHLVFRR